MNRRRLSLLTAAAVCSFTLSACGTGFGAQTNQQYQAGVGADLRTGPIQVLGAILVTNEDGSSIVSATVLNTTDSPQQLSALTIADSAGNDIPVASTRQLTTLLPGEALRLGSEGGPVFRASGIEAGRYFTITMVFIDAGEVSIDAPAVVRDAVYDDVVGSNSDDDPADSEAAVEEDEQAPE